MKPLPLILLGGLFAGTLNAELYDPTKVFNISRYESYFDERSRSLRKETKSSLPRAAIAIPVSIVRSNSSIHGP